MNDTRKEGGPYRSRSKQHEDSLRQKEAVHKTEFKNNPEPHRQTHPPHETVSSKGKLYAKEESSGQAREWLHGLPPLSPLQAAAFVA